MLANSLVFKLLVLIAFGAVCNSNGPYVIQQGRRQLHGISSDERSVERSNERVSGVGMMPQQVQQQKPTHPLLNLYATSASLPRYNGGPYRTFTSFGPPRPQTPMQQQPQPMQVYPGSSYVLDDSQEDNVAPGTAYVPMQPTGYTVAYYPTYPPTPSPTPPPVGPYLPAPPGHRPYCAKEGETYCENIDYYPTQLILRLLEYAGEDTLLSEEKINIPKTKSPERYNYTPSYFYDYTYTTVPHTPTTDSNSGEREKRQTQVEDLCPVDEKFVSAKAALTNEGDWKYVVNVPEVDKKYTQLVRVRRCRTPTCTGICTPPGGSTTACEQQYVMKRLVSLNPSGTKLEQDLFLFPDCCICKIRL